MKRLTLVGALVAGLLAAVLVSPSSVLVSSSSGWGVNCSNFTTQADAQAYFLARGGPASDPERLDGNHN